VNGDLYDGEWKNNVPYGEGQYTSSSGYVYVGAWQGGLVRTNPTLVNANMTTAAVESVG